VNSCLVSLEEVAFAKADILKVPRDFGFRSEIYRKDIESLPPTALQWCLQCSARDAEKDILQ
jgi:hypothetical protein